MLPNAKIIHTSAASNFALNKILTYRFESHGQIADPDNPGKCLAVFHEQLDASVQCWSLYPAESLNALITRLESVERSPLIVEERLQVFMARGFARKLLRYFRQAAQQLENSDKQGFPVVPCEREQHLLMMLGR